MHCHLLLALAFIICGISLAAKHLDSPPPVPPIGAAPAGSDNSVQPPTGADSSDSQTSSNSDDLSTSDEYVRFFKALHAKHDTEKTIPVQEQVPTAPESSNAGDYAQLDRQTNRQMSYSGPGLSIKPGSSTNSNSNSNNNNNKKQILHEPSPPPRPSLTPELLSSPDQPDSDSLRRLPVVYDVPTTHHHEAKPHEHQQTEPEPLSYEDTVPTVRNEEVLPRFRSRKSRFMQTRDKVLRTLPLQAVFYEEHS